MALKRGDTVIIRRPSNITEWPHWAAEMDKFHGEVITVPTIKDMPGSSIVKKYIMHEAFAFSIKWLEKPKDARAVDFVEEPSDEGRWENEEAGTDY